ncbi:hypothetical protein ACLOJK_004394 [Asimina triloba]
MYLHLDLDGRCLDCWHDGFGKMGFNPSGFGVVEEGAAVAEMMDGDAGAARWVPWLDRAEMSTMGRGHGSARRGE